MTPFWTVTLFWVAAVVSTVVALVFVLPALLRARNTETRAVRRDINIAVYRDQLHEMERDRDSGLLSAEQFETAKLELEARLAEDALALAAVAEPAPGSSRLLGYSLAVLIPVATFGLYFLLGNATSLMQIAQVQANEGQMMAHADGDHSILQLIQQVEAKTQSDPNNFEAWALLAKTYAAVEHWPEALHAYEKAYALRNDIPRIMSGYAEALAIANNRVMTGRPLELVTAALEKDPDDMKGLELAGIAAFQDRGYAKAAFYFKRLLAQLPPESPYAQDVAAAREEAERLAKLGQTGLDDLGNLGADTHRGATIRGQIDIAPSLKAKVAAGDTLFLFARPGDEGAPAAALRASAGQFPIEFELNDSMAMSAENRLSQFKEVTLVARVAKSGNIKGAAGDLEGTLKAVKVGADKVRLLIDTERK